MDTSSWIFYTHKCCACGRGLKDTGDVHATINLVQTEYRAAWAFPQFGNVLTGTSGIAGAVVCNDCIANKTPVRWALEYANPIGAETKIIYHPVESLEKIEPNDK